MHLRLFVGITTAIIFSFPLAASAEQRPLAFLTAQVLEGKVRIACYRSVAFFDITNNNEKADSVRLRIWRAELPDFQFGRDYEEFFDGLSWQDAQVVFEGAIPARNHRKYEYTDEAVILGQTYAYWIGTDEAETPTGPVAVRVRDPRVWWSWEEIQQRLDAMVAQAPDMIQACSVGKTVHGRPLRALVAGRRDRVLVLVGSVHAGESGPELIIPVMEHVVHQERALLAEVGLAILPCVNADERERLVRGYPPYLRTNSNGVDLNRNFAADWEAVNEAYGLNTTDPDSMTYRGPSPASEPETAALVRLFEGLQPAAVLSFHHLASLTGSKFLYPEVAAGDPAYDARCKELNRIYRAAMAPAGLEEKPILIRAVCTSGSFAAWIYSQFGVPAIDVEGESSAEYDRSAEDRATEDDLRQCQDRHQRAVVALMRAIADSP